MKPTKAELLEKYASPLKKVRHFLQIDVFDAGLFDSVVYPDRNGDCVFTCERYDLRTSDESLVVRVQIAEGAERGQVLRMLAKAISVLDYDQTWFKRRCYMCDKEMPADATEGVCSEECHANALARHETRYPVAGDYAKNTGSQKITRY